MKKPKILSQIYRIENIKVGKNMVTNPLTDYLCVLDYYGRFWLVNSTEHLFCDDYYKLGETIKELLEQTVPPSDNLTFDIVNFDGGKINFPLKKFDIQFEDWVMINYGEFNDQLNSLETYDKYLQSLKRRW